MKRQRIGLHHWVAEVKIYSYQDLILKWLKEHPNLSSAQVDDWLKEKHPAFEVVSSTI
ncbi:hypothetical protein [Peribacillus sp. SCS-155]|uniref:hypothetical protein n=1 Tax=Peribacillus sedimenti TaxID=3115297 RepID=UPI0039069C62